MADELPIADSYRVGESQLFAGEYPGALNAEEARRKVETLAAAGIDLLVDLTEEGELVPYFDHLPDRVEYARRPIRDLGLPSQDEMIGILDLIDDGLERGRSVYVHCWGGVGRTGTVVGCFLVRHGASGEEAIARIEQWRRYTPDGRRPSPETTAQWRMIVEWLPRQ
jgi:protein-tyrosine phosphatase